MNTPLDHNHDDLRHAEYALGVLGADARAVVAGEIETDPEAAARVAWWQQQLLPLIEEIPEQAPPDYVWARIQSALGHDADVLAAPRPEQSRPDKTRPGLWNSLPLWRIWGLAATTAAVVLVVLLLSLPQVQGPQPGAPAPVVQTPPTAEPAPAPRYMVARIQQSNGIAGWTATMDLHHARMVVVPATPEPVADDRSTELWLIPPGHKPISLGLIATDQPTSVRLSAAQAAQLGPKALLAVSVEPRGGSPTGQPTGPVVAKGKIGAIAGAPPSTAS